MNYEARQNISSNPYGYFCLAYVEDTVSLLLRPILLRPVGRGKRLALYNPREYNNALADILTPGSWFEVLCEAIDYEPELARVWAAEIDAKRRVLVRRLLAGRSKQFVHPINQNDTTQAKFAVYLADVPGFEAATDTDTRRYRRTVTERRDRKGMQAALAAAV